MFLFHPACGTCSSLCRYGLTTFAYYTHRIVDANLCHGICRVSRLSDRLKRMSSLGLARRNRKVRTPRRRVCARLVNASWSAVCQRHRYHELIQRRRLRQHALVWTRQRASGAALVSARTQWSTNKVHGRFRHNEPDIQGRGTWILPFISGYYVIICLCGSNFSQDFAHQTPA